MDKSHDFVLRSISEAVFLLSVVGEKLLAAAERLKKEEVEASRQLQLFDEKQNACEK